VIGFIHPLKRLIPQDIQKPLEDQKDLFSGIMRNPDMYKMNWFRNLEWKENQKSKERRIAKNFELKPTD